MTTGDGASGCGSAARCKLCVRHSNNAGRSTLTTSMIGWCKATGVKQTNHRALTYQHCDGAGAARGTGGAGGIHGGVRGHHDGQPPVPGAPLHPVHRVEHRRRAPEAGAHAVYALPRKERLGLRYISLIDKHRSWELKGFIEMTIQEAILAS